MMACSNSLFAYTSTAWPLEVMEATTYSPKLKPASVTCRLDFQ